MGISSSKSTNKPIYGKQIEGAGADLTNAYKANAGTIQGNADQLSGLLPGILDRYRNGDAGVNAARDYNVDVLRGRYLDQGNPYLNDMIAHSNDDIRNQLQASLGARGLTGGSDYAGLIADRIAKNTLGMRYADYGAERDRMTNAAGMSPSISAANEIPLQSAFGVSDAAQDPVRAAVGYAAGLGGLLGQYQKVKQKNAWGPIAAQAASNAAAAFAGGG